VPDFTVYDAQGNAHKLSDFRGKPVVLNFWASWCGPCKREMPDFDAAYKKYGEDIHFVMVNLTDGYRETKDSASNFIESNGYSFPVFYDTDMDAARVCGISSVPVTFYIDEEGYLIAVGQGIQNAESLEKGISVIK
jgi:thiol-disulfide isomerase/thioredoxin